MASKPPQKRSKSKARKKRAPHFIVTDDWDFEDDHKFRKFKTVKLKSKPSTKDKNKVKLKKKFRFIVEEDPENYLFAEEIKKKKTRKTKSKKRARKPSRAVKPHKKRRAKVDQKFEDFLKQYKIKEPRTYSQRKNLSRYEALLRDYREKNFKKKRRLTYQEEMEEMRQILKNLYTGQYLKAMGYEAEAQKYFKRALKKTTRRDGIPEAVPVGESPKNEGVDTSE